MGRYRMPPPVNAESVVGTGFEFKPEDDLLGQPPDPPTVELTPVGIAMPAPGFDPEGDSAAARTGPQPRS